MTDFEILIHIDSFEKWYNSKICGYLTTLTNINNYLYWSLMGMFGRAIIGSDEQALCRLPIRQEADTKSQSFFGDLAKLGKEQNATNSLITLFGRPKRWVAQQQKQWLLTVTSPETITVFAISPKRVVQQNTPFLHSQANVYVFVTCVSCSMWPRFVRSFVHSLEQRDACLICLF